MTLHFYLSVIFILQRHAVSISGQAVGTAQTTERPTHGTEQQPSSDKKKPNIVFIVAEDLGWDDPGFHGSPQIPTPTMIDLSSSGVLLNSYYISPSPFATKCEIMTGKYAAKLGVQHPVFHNKQPTGLPDDEKILPQYMEELGYSTHAVGKWGLGFYKKSYLPWNRGFKTFYGGLTSSTVDYFTHSGYDDNYGLDLRRNKEVVHNETGDYATELYTKEAVNLIEKLEKDKPFFLYVSHQAVHSGNVDDPLQVPKRYLAKLEYIKNPKRKLFAGMVSSLDESLLNISIALSDNGLMDNTIIIFTSVSGAAVGGMELSSGSNYPLRGSKLTVWEGGVRGSAFVYSDLIMDSPFVNEEMFHATDWLPTILGLAGGDASSIKGLDGFNVWDSMAHKDVISPRFEILHQFDPIQKNQCALRVGDYKIIINQDLGYYGDWFPRPAEVGELRNLSEPTNILPKAKLRCDKNYPHPFLEMHAPPCDPMRKPCLFNIEWDPCEFHNLAEFMPNTLKVLKERLSFYRKAIKSPNYPNFDLKSDPENNDGVWGPWEQEENANDTTTSKNARVNGTTTSANANAKGATNVTNISMNVNVNDTSFNSNSSSISSNNNTNHYVTVTKQRLSGSTDNSNSSDTNLDEYYEGLLDANNTTDNSKTITYPVQSERYPNVLVPGTQQPGTLLNTTSTPPMPDNNQSAHLPTDSNHSLYQDSFNHIESPIIINLPPDNSLGSADNSSDVSENKTEAPNEPSSSSSVYNPVLVNNPSRLTAENSTEASSNNSSNSQLNIPMQNQTPTNDSQLLLKMNTTTTYPHSVYPDFDSVLNSQQQQQKQQGYETNDTRSTPSLPSISTEPTQRQLTDAVQYNKDDANVYDGNNNTSDTVYIKDKAQNTKSYQELGTVNNQSATNTGIETDVAAQSHFLGEKRLDNQTQTTLTEKGLQVNKNQSVTSASMGNGNMQFESSDTSSVGKQDTKIMNFGQIDALPITKTADVTNIEDTGKDNRLPNGNDAFIPKQQQRGSGYLVSTANNNMTSVNLPSNSASLKPPDVKVTDTGEVSAGTGAGSATTSESSAGSAAKIDSSVSSVKDPYYSANLENIADAGGNQPHGINSSVTMTSGEAIKTKEMPTAAEFIKEPKYVKISQPEMTQPLNDVINPFEANKNAAAMEIGAGAGAGAGAGSESEAAAGSLADTLSSLKGKPKQNKNDKANGNQGKNLNSQPSLEEQLSGEPVVKAITDQQPFAKPQRIGNKELMEILESRLQNNGTSNVGEVGGSKDPFYIITDTMNAGTGTSTTAGSVSEAQVGAFGEAGAGSNSSGGSGSKLVGNGGNLMYNTSTILSNDTSLNPANSSTAAMSSQQALENDAKEKLAGSLKNMSLHGSSGKVQDLNIGGRASNAAIQRPFDSVSDVVSDSSNQLCAEGRDCIGKQILDEKLFHAGKGLTTKQNETEATSNELANASNRREEQNASAHNHAFKAQVWMDKKKFYVVGTASEVDNQTLPVGSVQTAAESSDVGAHNNNGNKRKLKESPTKSVIKKQNIGFNVMLPSAAIKQLITAPRFKERASFETATEKTLEKGLPKDSISIHQPKPKAAIRKVLDMITDPERTRKTQVPDIPDIVTTAIKEPDTYDQLATFKEGEAGDIGAVKPVSRDTVMEAKESETPSKFIQNDTEIDVTSMSNSAAQPSVLHRNGNAAGDLGSIVTLVGKVKSDRMSSKRMRPNSTSSGDESGDKKSTTNSEHLAAKHTQRNATGSEINAANIDKVGGPSNSIIVSSVIVVLIAAFVIVGMAVVAVVAVVARHCNLGRHLQTGS